MWSKLVRFYEFVCFLVHRFFEDRGTQTAGSLTYTTLFAVVPMLTVVFVMLSGIPALQDVGGQIQSFIFRNFVPSSGDKVQEYLQDFIMQARHLTWIGVAFLIATTFMMLITIEHAFNTIWRVKKPRRGLQRFLLYWALLSLGPLLLGAGFAISGYVMSLSFMSGDSALPWIANVLRYVPIFASILGFTLIYAAIPNTKVPIRHALISGVFTAVLIELARASFGLYVKTFPNFQFIYGAFAAVPLFLLWIYVSWLIVLVGCELCCCLGLRRYLARKNTPGLLVALMVLKIFYDAQQQGKMVTHRNVQDLGWSLPEDEWNGIVDFFNKEKLVCGASSGGWILCRDITQYPLHQLITHSPWPLPRADQLPNDYKGTWFERLCEAFIQIEQAEVTITEGSLASWLLDKEKPTATE